MGVVATLIGTVGLFACVLLFVRARTTGPPDTLGVRDGRLAPCPGTPNCVTSREGAARAGAVLSPLPFTGSLEETHRRLVDVVRGLPRTHLVVVEPRYVRAECRSRLFRYVDDVEFQLDEASATVHFRSASRVGRGDLGVNKARMEAIAKAYGAPP